MEVHRRTPQIPRRSRGELTPSPGISVKLKEKLGQLSALRIEPSAVQFSEGGTDFQGGFASVSRASLPYAEHHACRDPEEVAVKKMNIKSMESREKVLGLALREASFLVGLSHNNIVQLRGFVEDIFNDCIWLVFPWASNGNLRDFIALAEWEVPERIWLIRDVITGLQYLHTRDPPICHGDLKSINILVDSNRQAVLTDFGSSRYVQAKEVKVNEEPSSSAQRADDTENEFGASVNELENTMTLTGNKFTLRWAAPEVLGDDQVGTEADIWAFGWVCYEVMTSQIPFSETVKSTAVTVRIFKGDLPSLDVHARMSLIRQLGSLMVSCWSMAPAQRPTATGCIKSIVWLPMCVPRSPQALGTGIPEATLPLWLGHMYRRQLSTIKALEAFKEAFQIARQAKDSRLQAEALWGLAEIYRLRGEHAEAVKLYEECLHIREETGDRKGKADVLWGLADVRRIDNEPSKAISLYKECLQIREETGDKNGKAYALWGLAELHRMRGEDAKALSLFEECLRIREEISDRNGKADALWGLASVHRVRKEYIKAVPLYGECLKIREETGDRNGKAFALWGLAEVHRLRSDYKNAVPLYDECRQIGHENNAKSLIAQALVGLARVHADRGEHNDAVRMYQSAADLYWELGLTAQWFEVSDEAAATREQLPLDQRS